MSKPAPAPVSVPTMVAISAQPSGTGIGDPADEDYDGYDPAYTNQQEMAHLVQTQASTTWEKAHSFVYAIEGDGTTTASSLKFSQIGPNGASLHEKIAQLPSKGKIADIEFNPRAPMGFIQIDSTTHGSDYDKLYAFRIAEDGALKFSIRKPIEIPGIGDGDLGSFCFDPSGRFLCVSTYESFNEYQISGDHSLKLVSRVPAMSIPGGTEEQKTGLQQTSDLIAVPGTKFVASIQGYDSDGAILVAEDQVILYRVTAQGMAIRSTADAPGQFSNSLSVTPDGRYLFLNSGTISPASYQPNQVYFYKISSKAKLSLVLSSTVNTTRYPLCGGHYVVLTRRGASYGLKSTGSIESASITMDKLLGLIPAAKR